jgi:predicted transposase YbfD/YdcC
MDPQQYTSLYAALTAVPDPRQARGRRYPWPVLLLLIALALLCGQTQMQAIAEWTHLHTADLLPLLPASLVRLPSRSTLYRVLHQVDVAQLEAHLAAFARAVPPGAPAPACSALAVDGKWLRGASAHGLPIMLVSVVEHERGLVLAQAAVAPGECEQTVVPPLLAEQDLAGRVVTSDALHTAPTLAAQICAQAGDYLMMVKDNQPELRADIALLFAEPPWGTHPTGADYACATTVDKGHGRLETRTLECSPALNAYLDWPQVGQVLRRTCERINLQTGQITTHVRYGITSLRWRAVRAAQLERLWRGHWTIENRVHYVRDETWREDRRQLWRGQAAQALAALSNGVLSVLRANGHQAIAAALREFAAAIPRAVQLLLGPRL